MTNENKDVVETGPKQSPEGAANDAYLKFLYDLAIETAEHQAQSKFTLDEITGKHGEINYIDFVVPKNDFEFIMEHSPKMPPPHAEHKRLVLKTAYSGVHVAIIGCSGEAHAIDKALSSAVWNKLHYIAQLENRNDILTNGIVQVRLENEALKQKLELREHSEKKGKTMPTNYNKRNKRKNS